MQLTLGGLAALIAVIALGIAAMRDGSDLALRLSFMVTLALLATALLGLLVGRRKDPAWVGIAPFGWGHACLTDASSPLNANDGFRAQLFTHPLLTYAAERLHNVPAQPAPLPFQVYDPQLASMGMGPGIPGGFAGYGGGMGGIGGMPGRTPGNDSPNKPAKKIVDGGRLVPMTE